MKKGLGKRTWLCFFLVSVFVLPGFLQAQKQTIKVVVENASIRIKPDAGSDIIASPPVGSVFEVEGKLEEWYEVKYKTDLGVLVTGYIHEMYVEVEKPAEEVVPPKEEVKVEPVQPVIITEPTKPKPSEPAIRFSVRLGGRYSLMAGYNYNFSMTFYDEPLTITDKLDKAAGIGVNLDLGIIVMKYFELSAGVDVYSKVMKGTYGFGLPNIYIYDDIAYDDAPADAKRSMTVINFGINFHPLPSGPIRPYIGGGGSYIMAKMDLLEDMRYRETFYYPSWTHTIEIVEVMLQEDTSVSTLGFHARAGVHIKLTNNVFFFFEGKYLMAKKDVPHALTTQITGYEDEKITIDLGGASGAFGIRFLF